MADQETPQRAPIVLGETPQRDLRAAAYVVAGRSRDAEECRELLDMLGIEPGELRRTCTWCGTRREQLSAAIGSRWYCHGDGESRSCYEQAQRGNRTAGELIEEVRT
ncbi:hypothetical protein SAMN04487905_10640 [Actinopolyspora xinjiangensis]|uniref:Uncharacterized protein n=1 Tax=Actinopolyspora xinjiangensis TaxID=405564 RepID=A0A1H0U5C8_9ACTN|nr:hypothetical protein [Actinopolyspora xinjiangensis]SDP61026.1 hypothetical protein SAMN04487905_10640 [Actinopolyspora xinjiangensis]